MGSCTTQERSGGKILAMGTAKSMAQIVFDLAYGFVVATTNYAMTVKSSRASSANAGRC
jgi:hypothetical protein